MTEAPTLSKAALRQFIGSEHWYRHGLVRNVVFTDGAKYVADTAEAYWLLDEIALAQHLKRVAAEGFQSWKLKVNLAEHIARLACEDGNGKTVLTKRISYTDFPLEEVTLYFIDNTILLPSEY